LNVAARLRILIADDEPDLLELLQINLEIEGHDVERACDGTQALKLALAGRPDLVVLDVMMPGMDGLEVLRALRSEPGYAHLPVVLLTARGSGPEILEGRDSGADCYITKPFQMEELLDFIGQVRVRGEDDDRPHEADIAAQQTDCPVPGY
jgi:DNA-binding response OmpR family regulator